MWGGPGGASRDPADLGVPLASHDGPPRWPVQHVVGRPPGVASANIPMCWGRLASGLCGVQLAQRAVPKNAHAVHHRLQEPTLDYSGERCHGHAACDATGAGVEGHEYVPAASSSTSASSCRRSFGGSCHKGAVAVMSAVFSQISAGCPECGFQPRLSQAGCCQNSAFSQGAALGIVGSPQIRWSEKMCTRFAPAFDVIS